MTTILRLAKFFSFFAIIFQLFSFFCQKHAIFFSTSQDIDALEKIMNGLLMFIFIGLVSGWLAGVLVKGGGFGILGDIVVGILGAVIGGYFFNALGISAGGMLGAILVATVGAVILIFVLRVIRGV